MADCDADPAVMSWARRYTRYPQGFEAALRDALPQLTYVQQVAAEHDVAGEFVLLPWIESGFRPIPARHGRPAGMWQIMPATATAIGLHIDRRYDARLDVQAAADAVMKLLRRYYDEFHDWRVVDFAYNAGEYQVRRLMQSHGLPPQEPVVPRWPVRSITREHLTKLLAMACVVREPE
ncbi:MAG: transglycosylase SLT domain-containing protein, partial [Xanthomonadaceae bacterium]|nr:transglycosylase SLT domain-containing protein [Xanthomonadaceae bacterium]